MSSAARTPIRHCETQPMQSRQKLDCPDADTVDVGQDRLAHAKNFAAKLSDLRLREMAESYRKRWTQAARAKKAEIIQTVKTWTRATGPKSGPKAKDTGYAKVAIKQALRGHARFLDRARRWAFMNEAQRRALMEDGHAVSLCLLTALAISLCVTQRNNE